MLNLIDPPADPPREGPDLRLVPRGPHVVFTVPKETEPSWKIRAVAITLGVVISTVLVSSILFFGAFMKFVYDSIDAANRARAQQQQAAPQRPDGAIPVVFPEKEQQLPEGDSPDEAPARQGDAPSEAGGEESGPQGDPGP